MPDQLEAISKEPIFAHQAKAWHRLLIIGFLIAALGVRVYCSFIHPTTVQHDRLHHHQFIRSLVHGNYERNYEGPYYYLVAAAFTIGARELHQAFFPELPRMNVRIGIMAANFVLYVFLLGGLYALAKQLALAPGNRLLFCAFTAFLPVVQRSFNMARPENLMLPLTVWALVLLLPIFKADEAGNYRWARWLALVAALALSVTQKISGIVALTAVLAIGFCLAPAARGKRILTLATVAAVTLILCLTLWALQYQFSESVFYQHRESCAERCGPASPTVFVKFNPWEVWQRPFRNNHSDSMLNILFVDLFGDYWRYGIDAAYYHADPADISFRLARIRLGIVVSSLFFAALLGSLFWYLHCWISKRGGAITVRYDLAAFLLLPLAGHSFLIAAPYFSNYGQWKFDIIKWEYILWSMPFLVMPIIGVLESHPGPVARRLLPLILATVILGGMLQCLPLQR